jgi:tetratricopeptide (TPR) repeat protein
VRAQRSLPQRPPTLRVARFALATAAWRCGTMRCEVSTTVKNRVGWVITAMPLLVAALSSPAGLAESQRPDEELQTRGSVVSVGEQGGRVVFRLYRHEPRFVIDIPASSRTALVTALQASRSTSGFVIVHFSVSGAVFAPDRPNVSFPVQSLEYHGESFAAASESMSSARPVPAASTADAAFIRGLGLFYGGRYAQAIREIDAALAGGETADWVGRAHKVRGLAIADRVRAENPVPTDDGDREFVRALQDLRQWQGLEPRSADPLFAIANTLRELGAYPEALELYTAIGRRWHSQAFWAAIDAGVVERDQHHYPQALAELDRLGPQDGMPYHYHRGWTLSEEGRDAEAIEEFTAGLKKQPDYAWAFLKRSCAEARLGRVEEALDDQRKGLAFMRQVAGDSPRDRYDLQRAQQIESELQAVAALRGQRAAVTTPCEGYWGSQGRSRSPQIPADLPWVKSLVRAQSQPWSVKSLGLWMAWVVLVILIIAGVDHLRRRAVFHS